MAFPERVIVPQARDSENSGLPGSVWRGPVGEGDAERWEVFLHEKRRFTDAFTPESRFRKPSVVVRTRTQAR